MVGWICMMRLIVSVHFAQVHKNGDDDYDDDAAAAATTTTTTTTATSAITTNTRTTTTTSNNNNNNNQGNWNHLETIQKIPKQHTGKTQNQVSIDNSHIGHCTNSLETTDVKVQNIQHGK